MKAILVFLLLLTCAFTDAQSDSLRNDSLLRARQLNDRIYSRARKASIMSAVLPGLGQAYNRKYWKIPILYAGLGTLGYLFVSNNNDYNFYRRNLIALNDDDPSTLNTTPYDTQDLLALKKQYKNRRDYSAIGFVMLYLLNIVDANVDAHLSTFDVSDNLSLRVSPWENGGFASAGISVTLTFKR